MKTQQTPLNTPQPDNWEDLTEARQDDWMREHASTGAHSPLPWANAQGACRVADGYKHIVGPKSAWPKNAVDRSRLIAQAPQLKAHAQRLADALRLILQDCWLDDWKDAREALAQWEGDKQ